MKDKDLHESLRNALALGDPQQVAALIQSGADIHYPGEYGYDALIEAIYGRNVLYDTRLIELLTLLIDNGVSLSGRTTSGESAVSLLAWIGRFDALQLLLKAGADPIDLGMTELNKAIAFGSLSDVTAVINKNVDLEERDYWGRTAWLVALEIGDVAKAQLLMEHGVNPTVTGGSNLSYAIENGYPEMLRWLIDIEIDPSQTDDFVHTALVTAVEYNNAQAVEMLLQAGANVNQKFDTGTALYHASTREIALMLLETGADPLELSSEGRRAILGYPPNPDTDLLNVSIDDFYRFYAPRFGTQNPERMNNPFWEGMIRSGLNAYQGEKHVGTEHPYHAGHDPVWCAQRFGQSMTFLDGGRIIQIAGEHEDANDADFCIYNDVFVHDPDGTITIYGYPESIFPPTDFHTATLVGDYIYVIGSVGYMGSRHYGETPVYRLNVNTFQMECLQTTGDKPGWIYKHRALLLGANEIQITGGKILTNAGSKEVYSENDTVFILSIESLVWAVAEQQTA